MSEETEYALVKLTKAFTKLEGGAEQAVDEFLRMG